MESRKEPVPSGRPQTTFRLTTTGRAALVTYVAQLSKLMALSGSDINEPATTALKLA